jgi:hypothetical protein
MGYVVAILFFLLFPFVKNKITTILTKGEKKTIGIDKRKSKVLIIFRNYSVLG